MPAIQSRGVVLVDNKNFNAPIYGNDAPVGCHKANTSRYSIAIWRCILVYNAEAQAHECVQDFITHITLLLNYPVYYLNPHTQALDIGLLSLNTRQQIAVTLVRPEAWLALCILTIKIVTATSAGNETHVRRRIVVQNWTSRLPHTTGEFTSRENNSSTVCVLHNSFRNSSE